MAKIGNFDISAPINVKFGAGELPHPKFHVYRGNLSRLRGKKNIFGPLSKNNTGMAALRPSPLSN